MKLFLIRHADAIEYETDTVKTDEYRFITPKGRITTIKVAEHLKNELSTLDKIFTSPLIRAVQTAEIFATELKFKNDVELVNEIRNESTVLSLQKFIKSHSSLKSLAIVGHEPKMSVLVKSFSDKKYFTDFSKSGVCLINYDVKNETGKFEWYFDSKKMEFAK